LLLGHDNCTEFEWLASLYGLCAREKSSSTRHVGYLVGSKARFDLVTMKELTTLLKLQPDFSIHKIFCSE